MNDISPITPNKRYSCSSEYGTPGGTDDSDSSMYYLFVGSSDDDLVPNKENASNSTMVNMSPVSQPSAKAISKASTPLLRKVLQTNFTPRNKNYKRVSFSHTAKPCPSPMLASKVSKVGPSEDVFDMNPIKENLPIATIEQVAEQIRANAHSENGTDHSAVSDDDTDDLESDLHNTIIENPSNDTLTTNENAMADNEEPTEAVTEEPTTKAVETEKPITLSSKTVLKIKVGFMQSPKNSNVKTAAEVLLEASRKPSSARGVSNARKSILPVAQKPTRATTYKRRSSIYEPRKVDARKSLAVLKQVASKVTKTVADPKKAVVPNARIRRTTMFNAGTSSVATNDKKFTRASTIPNPTSNVAPKATTSKPMIPMTSTKPPLPKLVVTKPTTTKPEAWKNVAATKPRLTMANQAPRLAIASSRQTMSSAVRSQRRETRYTITAQAVAVASRSSASEPSTSTRNEFVKPSGLPLRKTAPVVASTPSGKCQYCDKNFAKSNALSNHLLEKCEKIPAAVRRDLLKKENSSNEALSKQVSRRKTQFFGSDSDSISKYSRFFVNVTNDASGVQSEAESNVEKGLKNLRAELRKTNHAHSGITRTPSKPLRCHICKKIFFNCVEYAYHTTNHPPLN